MISANQEHDRLPFAQATDVERKLKLKQFADFKLNCAASIAWGWRRAEPALPPQNLKSTAGQTPASTYFQLRTC
jgi:hypothetical protein